MSTKITGYALIGWLFALVLTTIGILNLVLVHPVPGTIYLLLAMLYIPATNTLLKERFGFTIHPAVKVILGVVVMWFTLGISDLAEMYGL